MSQPTSRPPIGRRVLVIGMMGAGKTTMARAISDASDIPFHELDQLFHGPGWSQRQDFVADVTRVVGTDTWVIDHQGYGGVLPQMWRRADTVVWLDYPRRVVLRRATWRFLRRLILRQRLWNGNRNSIWHLRFPNHPVRAAWANHEFAWTRFGRLTRQPDFQPLTVVRLRSPREADRWLRSLSAGQQAAPDGRGGHSPGPAAGQRGALLGEKADGLPINAPRWVRRPREGTPQDAPGA